MDIKNLKVVLELLNVLHIKEKAKLKSLLDKYPIHISKIPICEWHFSKKNEEKWHKMACGMLKEILEDLEKLFQIVTSNPTQDMSSSLSMGIYVYCRLMCKWLPIRESGKYFCCRKCSH